ncbi:S53 family peptidase [Streptomyces sp. NBC_01340]|uniref:S53 family peptidase n=1 Tax=unclassified Streptomyces TaxID=2593676 RepID=UPI00225A47B7|nr:MULTISPECIES: S53 family peptidase [unclassified Streptomyces]MCX4455153.1 S53 family peptidase [Streptomyces sp. NBC_01719]MCX4494513.1 S53 family peptidase [Streptomyces sp. NBC_01728]WSI39567.1 S53 family peptidase [Streptomyces sp. NBC_01340]
MRTSIPQEPARPAIRGKWRRIGAAAVGTAALVLAGLGTAVDASAAPATTTTARTTAATSTSAKVTWSPACSTPAKGQMACKALRVTGGTTAFQKAGAHADAVTPKAADAATPSGYGPSNLQSAYGLTSAAASNGSGETIAIVDAYNDPNAEADLAKYRSYYGLSACTTANGCFKKVSQTGSTTSLPSSDAGWSEEISLDVDMASAICPNCNILLVEATSATMANLGKAVNEAVTLGAKYVSNSYGGSESSSDSTYDTFYFNHPGVAITVSAGDSGYGAEYPAASKYVTSVGGTALSTSSNSRGWTESVWETSSTEGTGSGCSSYDAKPTWQTDTGCSKRTIADVSAVADPATGVSVYDSYGVTAGWYTFGGTSASSPIIAGVYALGGTPSSSSYPASFPYASAGTSALNDVTSGSNGSCGSSYLCTAKSGYDGPTGWGTPEGVAAFTG